MAPSPLAIATSSLQRLIKEEASYHKELSSQEARLAQLIASKSEDENAEFALKQERTAIEETKAVFPPLRQRIADALLKLEDQVEAAEGGGGGVSEEELGRAREVVGKAKEAVEGQ